MDGLTSAQMDTLLDKPSTNEEFCTTAAPDAVAKEGSATGGLTTAQIDVLLDKLCGDDVFRAQLLDDPVAALRQIGAPVQLAECFRMCKKLADPDVLKASRTAIQRQLGMTLSANIHDLRAG